MYSRILVPVDGSATSLKGLNEAIKLAKELDAELKLVHVVNEWIGSASFPAAVSYQPVLDGLREHGRKVLSEAEAVARSQAGEVECEMIEVVAGRAADSILDAAKRWRAELIVMGTHGRRGLSRLAMGSDAELVLRGSRVPVLMVRDLSEAE